MRDPEMLEGQLFGLDNCILRALLSGIPAIQHIDNGPGYAGTELARSGRGSRAAKESELLERMDK